MGTSGGKHPDKRRGKDKQDRRGSGGARGGGGGDVRVSLFSQLAQADLVPSFTARQVACKVHDCSNTWTWSDKDQAKAWREMPGADPQGQPDPPHRMCKRCHGFCRSNQDIKVACPRSDCDNTRSYRLDQQLHDLIAGRKVDPPPPTCSRCATTHRAGETLLLGERPVIVPDRAELMACIVPGCSGRWILAEGIEVEAAPLGSEPADRMCDSCRVARQHEPRMDRFGADA